MVKRLSKLFSLGLIMGFLANANGNFDQCKSLLDFIYREISVNTLDLSYERAMSKMLLGLHTVHENTKHQRKYKKKLTQIFNALKKIDPELKAKLSNNQSTKKHWWRFSVNSNEILNNTELQNVFHEWAKLQQDSPELFSGLEDKYKLDSWDTFTMDLIGQASNLNFANSELKEKVMKLGNNLRSSSAKVLNGGPFNEKGLIQDINQAQQELKNMLNKHAADIAHDYRSACNQKSFDLFLKENQVYCPLPDNDISLDHLNEELINLQKSINATGLLNSPNPVIESPHIDISLLNYRVSDDKKSTYCKRNPELISYIVIHHTSLSKDTSPIAINNYHVDNPEHADDPWFMIGYNYIISETFQGATTKSPKVFQGRPPEMQGAHTGGDRIPLTDEQKEYMKNETISCGNEHIGFEKRDIVTKAEEDGGVKGNFFSYGVAISGNYNYVEKKIGNTKINNGLKPGTPTTPSHSVIKAAGKLACDLQKKNPRIKTIVPHSFFNKTKCPGRLIEELYFIMHHARVLGCKFDVLLSKEELR